ncbi:MAG TPA: hypothetical protein VGZ47_16410 [Gemmataceae bacterium]|nr:hypothetical protein [Gemmataceae bacterium]
MTLLAAQLIYTNVEKSLSRGREGFQIWLRTPDSLSESEETEIQTRLGDFEERKDDSGSVRHQFFQLASGKLVFARSVPLEESDRHNRAGRFYAHALILKPEEFRQLHNDPFPIFRHFAFQSSPADGLAASGDAGSGHIPGAALDGWTSSPKGEPIGAKDLPPLLQVLLRTCHGQKPLILGLTASSEQVLNVLEQLFRWLPMSLRSACSFDTLSGGRSLSQVRYSVVGLPLTGFRARYSNLVSYDPAKQSLSQASLPPAESSFDQWLLEQLPAGAPPERARSEAAFQLGECLDSGCVNAKQLAAVDSSLYQQLACSPRGILKLERLLVARLQADAGEFLATLLASHARDCLHQGGIEALGKLEQPIDSALLLRWLLAIYEQRGRDEIQREAELTALKEFLDRTKNVNGAALTDWKKLAFVMYRWAGWWSRLARYATDETKFPDEVFHWFVPWAMRTLPIQVEPGSGPGWCGPRIACSDPAENEECQKLLEAILGQAPPSGSGEGGDSGPRAPVQYPADRWNWVLQYLLQMLPNE